MEATPSSRDAGRPYRSHLHPACFSCRKRKSRCKVTSPAEVCVMCHAYGTECIFPQPDDPPTQRRSSPRKPALKTRSSRSSHSRSNELLHRPYPDVHALPQSQPVVRGALTHGGEGPQPQVPATFITSTGTSPQSESNSRPPPQVFSHLTEAEEDSSHIVSPAVADDNDILESYLSAIPSARKRYLIRTGSNSNGHLRPVRFNVVPRRPLGVVANRSLAASKCEIIEKYIEPDVNEYLNLWFLHANSCFALFDEASFRSSYASHKDKISPALLCNLYANSLVYWKNSAILCVGRTPDNRYIWNQANEALHSEMFLSPGISTIMAILLNVWGRPSTSMFGNGGLVGMAVALSNALGLNRDPSAWNISTPERSLRIRLWWLVVIQDRWCSLAYGTPLQVHRAQYDVPFPTVNDLCASTAAPHERAAASIFVALTTLTDVLARYLEYVYSVSTTSPQSPELSEMDLEQVLGDWEESLSDDVRYLVLRGTHLEVAGAANFRLAYLAVKLLLRRIQLNMSKSTLQLEDDAASPYYMHAQRAAEEIAYLVQELKEGQFRGFWIPVHAFSLTSATMFLLRSGLRMRTEGRSSPLKIARDMVTTLGAHRRNYDWDLADNCLSHCGEILDQIGVPESEEGVAAPDFTGFPDNLDFDASALDELLGTAGFMEGFVF
ncbi:fungal-specific transcription factor domain-containing protein [Aspergillus karnatakaensis]|uniref:Zn(II)2Cys6 transcription factor n=1 Tax=Aspergillus karnatakaensis TaxID=1810916 RepID=UPI003CCCE494